MEIIREQMAKVGGGEAEEVRLYQEYLISTTDAMDPEDTEQVVAGENVIDLKIYNIRRQNNPTVLFDQIVIRYDMSLLIESGFEQVTEWIYEEFFTGLLHCDNIPYNLLLFKDAFIIIPRQHQIITSIQQEKVFEPAFGEMFGCLIIKDQAVWGDSEEKKEGMLGICREVFDKCVSVDL